MTKTVEIGDYTVEVQDDETAADLYDKLGDAAGGVSFDCQTTLILRRENIDERPEEPTRKDGVSFTLDEIEDGDTLDLYRVRAKYRPVYSAGLRA